MNDDQFLNALGALLDSIEMAEGVGVPELQTKQLHHHKCPDCGHVWAHVQDPRWSKTQHAQAHSCPECGTHEDNYTSRSTYVKTDSKGRDMDALRAAGLPIRYNV